MKKAYKLATIAGIDLFIHWSFLAGLAALYFFFLYQGASLTAALFGLIFIVTVFGCVVLHEYGHGLMARHYGIKTIDITMYPIGGVARLESMPREPKQELMIALAGPAVNVAIGFALLVVNIIMGQPIELQGIELSIEAAGMNFWGPLMWINFMLAAFNMLPAFPMDGGRVLRAGLATKLSYRRATQIAALVAQGMAGLFVVWGLGLLPFVGFNPGLLVIAVFVFFGARQEARHVAETEKAEKAEKG